MRLVDGNGSGGLNLESLLRAQERVTESERDYVTSVLTYNLSMINLKRSNGTLLQSENVIASKNCQDGCSEIDLNKGQPNDASQVIGLPQGATFIGGDYSLDPAQFQTPPGVQPAAAVGHEVIAPIEQSISPAEAGLNYFK